MGGGRGDHAAVWARRGLFAVVLDPAAGMLQAAARRAGVRAVGGSAQALPFRSGSFHLVYFHLSIHYGDWRLALEEAVRVLVPGGRVEVWTLGPEHHARSHLARWFPSVAEIDRRRFPGPGALASHLETLGCRVGVASRPEAVWRRAGDWVAAVRAGFVSTLQLLAAEEIEAGLRRFRREHPRDDEVVTYELGYVRVRAAP